MLVIVAPGQGSQSPGMLDRWLELPGAAEEVAAWSELTALDLAALGTTGDTEQVRDTAHAQPLLITLGVLSATALGLAAGLPREQLADLLSGHSVGELTSAALADVLTDDDAVQLAAFRGKAMKEAAEKPPSGMSAVLGGDPVEVSARLVELGLVAANVNAAGQVVAAGPIHRLERLRADPPAGARVRPLPVAGAFHTDQMAPAAAVLADIARQITATDPSTPMVANADGMVYLDGPALLSVIVGQVASPVRWDICQRTFSDMGVTGLLEMAPGGTLTGLARRELPGVATLALKSPDDVDAAAAFVAEHRVRSTIPSRPRYGAEVEHTGGSAPEQLQGSTFGSTPPTTSTPTTSTPTTGRQATTPATTPAPITGGDA